MRVVALLTDYGLKDPYVSKIKGKFLSFYLETTLVDISHEVSKFHLPQAAYTLQATWRDFPEQSIIVIDVDHPFVKSDIIVCRVEGRYLIAPNNGILSLLQNESHNEMLQFDEVRVIKSDGDTSFPFYENLKKEHLDCVFNGKLSQLGEEIPNGILTFKQDEIKLEEQSIEGHVIYIDSYGNIVTNIHKSIFEDKQKGRAFEIKVGAEYITNISTGYKVGSGAKCIALFNSLGYLEIALTDANASNLLGTKAQTYMNLDQQFKKASEQLGIQYDTTVSITFSNQLTPLL
ncbi:SAM-dependent chlorinase/fluorinase [Cyclobacteriaceae bacterium]|nr:SAM-dependent chlorinase/fluorinase [Cyclobacteriaceae bacterium]